MASQKCSKRYDAILFDVVDTLLTKTPPAFQVFAGRCQEAGIQLDLDAARKGWKQSERWVTEQILREIAGEPRMPDHEFFKRPDFVALRTAFSEKTDEEIWEMVSLILPLQGSRQSWQIIEGIRVTLERLMNAGYKLGVVSNFDNSLSKLLEQFDLNKYFNAVITASFAGVEKPDPKILKIACQRLKVNPKKSLYVGDHPFDVLCAKKAGMAMVWIRDESDTLPPQMKYKPDHRLSSVTGIEKLLL